MTKNLGLMPSFKTTHPKRSDLMIRSPVWNSNIAVNGYDQTDTHSFGTLLTHLSTIVRNQCQRKGATSYEEFFFMTTTPSAKQQRALDPITLRESNLERPKLLMLCEIPAFGAGNLE